MHPQAQNAPNCPGYRILRVTGHSEEVQVCASSVVNTLNPTCPRTVLSIGGVSYAWGGKAKIRGDEKTSIGTSMLKPSNEYLIA